MDFRKPPEPRQETEIMADWVGSSPTPVVSILCPTYNHAPFIKDALNSFLMQETSFPFEIIVHDDASTDDTSKIISEYVSRYPSIIRAVLQKENQYSRGNRPLQFLINILKGKYCALCEGDDYWTCKDKLAKQIAAMESRQGIGLSTHPALQLDVHKGRTRTMFHHGDQEAILSVNKAVESASQFSPTSSYIFRSTLFSDMPEWFFSSQDLPFGDYFIETIIGRFGLLYLPYTCSVYRRNVPDSYTDRTKHSPANVLEKRMRSILLYTQKLDQYPEISKQAIICRVRNIHRDYRNMAIRMGNFELFRSVHESCRKFGVRTSIAQSIGYLSPLTFTIYIHAVKASRSSKRMVAALKHVNYI